MTSIATTSARPTAIDFLAEADAIQPELAALRRRLHRDPELGLHLPRTQAAVLAALEGLPLEISTGRELSSVVAVLRGTAPARGERTTVLLRGDMDGLPVTEATGLDYAAADGTMHACGHDLHTAGLVGAARLLSAHVDQLPGDVVFMFQPGEEGPGGAEPMIAEGVLEASGRRVDAAYGVHVLTSEAAGSWSTRGGPLLAGVVNLTLTITGRGGHGSTPYAAIDPVPVAAEVVLALQSYVSRRGRPFDPIVITVGRIEAGTAANVIPETATLDASIRVLSQESIDQLLAEIPRLAEGIGGAHGCTVDVRLALDLPVTHNDPAEAAFALAHLRDLHGPDRVRELAHPRMGSEDFSFVLNRVPGAFLYLGAHPHPLPAE
ncbi:MAG: M20 family metallopeptidase, partial [Micrococcus sp.]|nr:M20 family metallopeptidase [Micrococcus sp.]